MFTFKDKCKKKNDTEASDNVKCGKHFFVFVL